MQWAMAFRGKACKAGFEIITIDEDDPFVNRLKPPGKYVWTQKERVEYTIYSGTREARELMFATLGATSDNLIGALISGYGAWGECHDYRGGFCYSICDAHKAIVQLQELFKILKDGGFTESDPLALGVLRNPHFGEFHYGMYPTKEPPGFMPILQSNSILTFAGHEVLSFAYGDRPMVFCRGCTALIRPEKRRDTVYCTQACKQKHFRMRHRLDQRTPPE